MMGHGPQTLSLKDVVGNSLRNVHLTYQGESVEARVVKGCPQGGVLSPLLWYMVVDSLLLKLNALGYTAQAYADDLAIVI